MTDDKKTIPMDNTMPEGEAVASVHNPRNCYAMEQLIEEVTNLFPETEYEVSDRSPRGVAFSIQFAMMPGGYMGLRDLLTLIEGDDRVLAVIADAENVMVTFRPNPVLMDSRESFNLASAWEVMGES